MVMEKPRIRKRTSENGRIMLYTIRHLGIDVDFYPDKVVTFWGQLDSGGKEDEDNTCHHFRLLPKKK